MPEWVSDTQQNSNGEDPAALPLTEDGRLRSGIHTYTLSQLRPLLATTPYRRAMWNRFIAFMGWPIMVEKFSHVYIGGKYPSEASRPQDIDLILQTLDPYGPGAFLALERFFRVGLDTIEKTYGVHLHFWMENAPAGVCDYKAFFQYSRPKMAEALIEQGLICVSLTDPDIKERYAEMVGGFEMLDDTPPREP